MTDTPNVRPRTVAATVALALLAAAGLASAQTTSRGTAPPAAERPNVCPCAGGERLTAGGLRRTFEGRTVCATLGSERWTDFHKPASGGAPGELWSYRRGPGHPIDPTMRSGGWVIEGTSRAQPVMTYVYGSSRYSYAVCQEGAQVHFCGIGPGSRNITGATMRDGQVPCN
jgi:hypothetical protein